MIPLEIITMLLVGFFGAAVVLTRDPLHQVIVLGIYGLALISLFMVLQAPDVTLSAIVIGVLAYPVMVLLTLAKVRSKDI